MAFEELKKVAIDLIKENGITGIAKRVIITQNDDFRPVSTLQTFPVTFVVFPKTRYDQVGAEVISTNSIELYISTSSNYIPEISDTITAPNGTKFILNSVKTFDPTTQDTIVFVCESEK